MNYRINNKDIQEWKYFKFSNSSKNIGSDYSFQAILTFGNIFRSGEPQPALGPCLWQ